MTPYRARLCPRCRYYIGYMVGKHIPGTPEASVKSFCLNCSYQLPVRAIVRGTKYFPSRRSKHRAAERLQRAYDFHETAEQATPSMQSRETIAPPANYSRDLRAIGQRLESRRFTNFNLKCSGDAYFVWSTEILPAQVRSDIGDAAGELYDPAVKMLLDRIVGFQYNADDVERLERDGIQNRRPVSGRTDGRRLSHLLRTVGEQVYQRNQRLLAITWQENQIGVVAETAGGRCEMNLLRSDNLYDLWVRMYLRRSH